MADQDRRNGLSAAWGVIAALATAAAFAIWTAAASPGSHFSISPTYICGVAAPGALYMMFASLYGIWPTGSLARLHQQKLPQSMPAKSTTAVSPLIVNILEDSQFENWRYIALIAALHVQIENTTENPIPVASYGFMCSPAAQPPWDHHATGNELMSVHREISRRDSTQQHGQPLRHYARIPAHAQVEGWPLVPVTRQPAGGTPACTSYRQRRRW